MQAAFSFDFIGDVDATTFYVRDRGGIYRIASDDEIVAGARKVVSQRLRAGQFVTSPTLLKEIVALRMANLECEGFAVAFFDHGLRMLAFEIMFRGTLTQTSVYPREVAKRALELNASGVALAHNHPSGQVEPSMADQHLTEQIKRVLSLLDVRVIDHIITGTGGAVMSFSERGLL